MIRTVAVFCGSQPGHAPVHRATARRLGLALARRGLTLVYGGGRVGLMGELADAVLAEGGRVVGVIPGFLRTAEVVHPAIPPADLVVTPDLFRRKEEMLARADAFVAMPGGLGTLDELFEVVTLAQLGRLDKPCALLDPTGFFAPLHAQLDLAVATGFLAPRHRALLASHADPERLLDALAVPPSAA